MGEFADLEYGTSLPAVRRSPTRGIGMRCRAGYGGLAEVVLDSNQNGDRNCLGAAPLRQLRPHFDRREPEERAPVPQLVYDVENTSTSTEGM